MVLVIAPLAAALLAPVPPTVRAGSSSDEGTVHALMTKTAVTVYTDPIVCSEGVNGHAACMVDGDQDDDWTQFLPDGFFKSTVTADPGPDCIYDAVAVRTDAANDTVTLIGGDRAIVAKPGWYGTDAGQRGVKGKTPQFVTFTEGVLGHYAIFRGWVDVFKNYKLCTINFEALAGSSLTGFDKLAPNRTTCRC